ncbi:MAG: hypothetical protein ACXWQ5_12335, partial [Ktedonobacterales bacterium]
WVGRSWIAPLDVAEIVAGDVAEIVAGDVAGIVAGDVAGLFGVLVGGAKPAVETAPEGAARRKGQCLARIYADWSQAR